jgi:hypothetical protein
VDFGRRVVKSRSVSTQTVAPASGQAQRLPNRLSGILGLADGLVESLADRSRGTRAVLARLDPVQDHFSIRLANGEGEHAPFVGKNAKGETNLSGVAFYDSSPVVKLCHVILVVDPDWQAE